MFGFRKSTERMSVEEFVTRESTGAPTDGGAAGEREDAPKAKGWLIASVVVAVGLLALCVAAFVKIHHLSRDVALLRSQVSGKAVDDRITRLERELQAMKQVNAREARGKTKIPTKKGTADKKKTLPH